MRISTQHSAVSFGAANRPASALTRLRNMMALSRQRASLADLPEHLLSDIGVSREDATAEAARAPWDAPQHWRG